MSICISEVCSYHALTTTTRSSCFSDVQMERCPLDSDVIPSSKYSNFRGKTVFIRHLTFFVFMIHPRDEQDVARRLTLELRAVVYNEWNLIWTFPQTRRVQCNRSYRHLGPGAVCHSVQRYVRGTTGGGKVTQSHYSSLTLLSFFLHFYQDLLFQHSVMWV